MEALEPKFTWGHVIEMIIFITLPKVKCSYRVQLTNKRFYSEEKKKNKKFLQELVIPSLHKNFHSHFQIQCILLELKIVELPVLSVEFK